MTAFGRVVPGDPACARAHGPIASRVTRLHRARTPPTPPQPPPPRRASRSSRATTTAASASDSTHNAQVSATAAAAADASRSCAAPDAPAYRAPMDDIARCDECLAYINCFATFHREQWKCPLCATYHTYVVAGAFVWRSTFSFFFFFKFFFFFLICIGHFYSVARNGRYWLASERSNLPELNQSLVFCDVAPTVRASSGAAVAAAAPPPLVLFFVDLTAVGEELESIKRGMRAAVEALNGTNAKIAVMKLQMKKKIAILFFFF